MNRTVTATDAKKMYKLTETDLEAMATWSFSTRYHDCVRRFLKTDVEARARNTYGTNNVNDIATIYNRNKHGIDTQAYPEDFQQLWMRKKRDVAHGKKTAYTRYKKIARDYPDCLTGIAMMKERAEDYIIDKDETGLQSFANIGKLIQQINTFNARMTTEEDRLPDVNQAMTCKFTRRIITDYLPRDNVDSFIERYKSTVQRKARLVAALAEKGLELRSDSVLCREYIHDGSHNLNTIVGIMENMHFLHQHTDYETIYENMLDDAFEQRRNDRRDGFDYYIDKHEVSDEAQSEAVRDYMKNGGDVNRIPLGLQINLAPDTRTKQRRR